MHHPSRGVTIREKAPLDVSAYVQIESDWPYCRARFFDSGTDQPFLAESAVYEEGIQAYLDGVKADLGFSRHLETVRLKLLPEMHQNSALLETYRISPHQAEFLKEFSRNWRAGKMPLGAPEIERLIQLGYLTRDAGLGATERVTTEASIDRTRRAMEDFETRGKELNAAQCRAKMRKLERRIEARTLMITSAGKTAAKKLPYQVKLDGNVL